jgi:hypothetical protein
MVTATALLTLLERRCVTLSIDPAGPHPPRLRERTSHANA